MNTLRTTIIMVTTVIEKKKTWEIRKHVGTVSKTRALTKVDSKKKKKRGVFFPEGLRATLDDYTRPVNLGDTWSSSSLSASPPPLALRLHHCQKDATTRALPSAMGCRVPLNGTILASFYITRSARKNKYTTRISWKKKNIHVKQFSWENCAAKREAKL